MRAGKEEAFFGTYAHDRYETVNTRRRRAFRLENVVGPFCGIILAYENEGRNLGMTVT